METSKLFRRLSEVAGIRNPNRGLSVIHSNILDRLQNYEDHQFEKQCPKITFKQVPVKRGGKVVGWL